MTRYRTALSVVLGLTFIAAAAVSADAGRVSPIKAKLSTNDKLRLARLKGDHRRQIAAPLVEQRGKCERHSDGLAPDDDVI